jgi:hypothetical protein
VGEGAVKFLQRLTEKQIGWLLFIGGFLALLLTEKASGFVRDEGIYFVSAESYGHWWLNFLKSPSMFSSDQMIVGAWQVNSEHPALLKSLFGLSWLFFHEWLGWFRDAASFRMPSFAFGALILPLTYAFARPFAGKVASAFAAITFLLIPRQFFEAHLACFDVPIAALWLLTVYCFWKSQTEKRYWLYTGLAFGAAIASKHNALFMPFVLSPFGLVLAWQRSKDKPEARETALQLAGVFLFGAVLFLVMYAAMGLQRFAAWFEPIGPQMGLYLAMIAGGGALLWKLFQKDDGTARALAPLWAMAALGPFIFYASWPYLWHHPVERTSAYLAFHATHNHYAWFYLGEVLREPPFPWSYVLVKTALTVPTSLFVPMGLGFLWLGVRAVRRTITFHELLIAANCVASIAIISHPDVPHFGGVKHWFPSMPFLAMAMAACLTRASESAGVWLREQRKQRWAEAHWVAAALAVLCGVPALIANVRVYPYGTSHYSEIAGGLPGAATMGMQRQFWSNNVTGVLPWLNQNAAPGSRIYLHEVTGDSIRHYQRNGMLRSDVGFTGQPWDADYVAYQYHQEFREHEFNTWQALGTTKPVYGLYVDETPQVIVYKRR